MRAISTVAGQGRDFRQGCLEKCENRRRCLSIVVCARVETYVPGSLKRGSLGPGRRIYTKLLLYALITRGCSGQGPLHRHLTRSAASADPTQLLLHQ